MALVPALCLVTAAGLGARLGSAADDRAVRSERLGRASAAAASMALLVQAEGDVESALLSGASPPQTLEEARRASDAGLSALRRALSDLGSAPPAGTLAPTLAPFETLEEHRAAFDAGALGPPAVRAFVASAGQAARTAARQASSASAPAGSDWRSQHDRYLLFLVALAGGGTLVSALAAAAVSRSITRPLSKLTVAAERAANLPDLVEALRRPSEEDRRALALAPLALRDRGEVGRAGAAVDAFQGAAARLAMSHAKLLNRGVADQGTNEVLVNLARRVQGLVDHQVEFLDGLEAGEDDPDSLDDLFRLDRLATRVRRNAESLLTLAGLTTERGSERPVPVVDVIRAAAAEVEDQARIEVDADAGAPLLLGNLANDTAHLLSELLENATRWSPPQTRVVVSGRRAGGGYQIVVLDNGVGMSGRAMAEANKVLGGPTVAAPTVARSLGLVVAGRLARRLGLSVELAPTRPSGVTATVTLPATLLLPGPPRPEDAGRSPLPFALVRQEHREHLASLRRQAIEDGRGGDAEGTEEAEAVEQSLAEEIRRLVGGQEGSASSDAGPGDLLPAPPAAVDAGPPEGGAQAPLPPPAGLREDEYRRILERATAAGLVRRVPVTPPPTGSRPGAEAGAGLPEHVRSALSRYWDGARYGRQAGDEAGTAPAPADTAAAVPDAPLDAGGHEAARREPGSEEER